MLPVADLLRQVTRSASSPENVPISEIRSSLEEFGLARVRGLFDPDAMRSATERIAASFDSANDRKHDPSDTEAVRSNFQKLVIGGITGMNRHRSLARFLRMLYNPIFADDLYGMRAHFVRLARVRNRLYELPEGFAVHDTQDGFWTAARIHQYPRGGGFMVPHTDLYSRMAATEAHARYAQLFIVMSRKGEDYKEGGAFLERDEERLFYEDDCEPGDLIVYDGRSIHGVGDIDPLEPLDLTRFTGRIVAFASLYRHLRPGQSDYTELARKAKQRYGHSS